MNKLYIVVSVVIVALVVVLALQNTEVVTVRFLAWDFSMSRFVLLLLATAGGFVAGFVAGKFVSLVPK